MDKELYLFTMQRIRGSKCYKCILIVLRPNGDIDIRPPLDLSVCNPSFDQCRFNQFAFGVIKRIFNGALLAIPLSI